MTNPIISLTSDFGEPFAQAQIEAVIYALNPEAKFISVTDKVSSFSILEGAFILSKFYGFTPQGSIHIAIIDPGVGSERRGIILKSKNHWFVGPDNGVLYPAAASDGIEKAYVINERLFNTTLLNTFHGRDVFAKAAASILLDKHIKDFAKEVSVGTLVKYVFPQDTVAHTDFYGNIKLTTQPNGYKRGQSLQIEIKGKVYAIPYCKTFADVAPNELLIYHGSHDTLELAVNLGSAAKRLNLNVGDIVRIQSETVV